MPFNTNREPLSCKRNTTLEFLSSLSAARSFLERLSLACLMFSGLIRSRRTLAKIVQVRSTQVRSRPDQLAEERTIVLSNA